MKRSFLYLLLAIVLSLTLTACQTSRSDKPEERSAKETTESAAQEKVFKSSDELFQLTADDTWKNASKILDIEDASIAIGKNDQAYITLISEYRYNFADELSGYHELVVKNMQDHIDKDETGETEELRLGDHDAFKTEITGKVDGEESAYVIYCVEIEDYYVQVICWSGTSDQEKFAAEFDKIARSLMSRSEAQENSEESGNTSDESSEFSWDRTGE